MFQVILHSALDSVRCLSDSPDFLSLSRGEWHRTALVKQSWSESCKLDVSYIDLVSGIHRRRAENDSFGIAAPEGASREKAEAVLFSVS